MPGKTCPCKRAYAFISVHALVVTHHRTPRPISHSPRKSIFNGSAVLQTVPRRLSARVVCGLTPSQGDKHDAENGDAEGGSSSWQYFATYESWRNPNWLRNRELNLAKNPTLSRPGDSEPFFTLPKEQLVLKLSCSAALLSLVGLLSLAYVRLNTLTHQAVRTAAATTIARELNVGRVVRCNPITGIKLRNVSLPMSATHPTAPVISASDVEITLSGFLRSIFMRRALRVNVRLDGAEIRVSQVLVNGPKGDLVGQWDPGLYFADCSDSVRETGQQDLMRILRFLQPGRLSIRNAHVFIQPADFLDYSHGDEVIEVQDASADVTFPVFKQAKPGGIRPVEIDGDFKADVRGTPVDGGSIEVQCEMNGNILPDLKPEDPIVSLRVAGEGVHANRVASFLSLPFRADQGTCTADVSMDFLYKSKSLVPLMRGEAQLDEVALRFHPDPKTPKFHRINGKLRFEGKTLFLDGPVGELGTLPMTVVGDIHLEDGYNLMGYVRPVDVNNIIETFDVDKFVPVMGLVAGEAQLAGPLDEPVVTGWAESVGQNSVFDRLPMDSANVSFEWDAIAGILKFSEIAAKVKGGGSVNGSGSLFFDMTKESPYGISQKEHSPRSPKASYWNPNSRKRDAPPLRPLPRDELEIDEQSPFRPYDSMRFDFKASGVNGGDLVKYYGGEHGQMATETVGLVSGEGILAGHAKDANCRVVWRSTTPPPPIPLYSDGNETRDTETAQAPQPEGANKVSQGSDKSGSSQRKSSSDQERTSKTTEVLKSAPGHSMLGGGDFRGLVYLKLGDLPDARRVKVRTTVKNLDARRMAWADKRLQKALAHAPLLEVSMDTYFKGVMSQRPVLLPGQNKVPRTPRMELLGADGALAVKNLTMNGVKFENIMSGSLSFSISDFSLSVKEVVRKRTATNSRSGDAGTGAAGMQTREQDELTVALSVKGNADFCFRLGNSEMIGAVSKDERDHQRAAFFARNIVVEDFIGKDTTFSSGETLAGIVNADMKLDLTSRKGDGNLSLDNPRVGPMNFSSVMGNLVWRDNDLYLENGNVKYRRSVYQIDARYSTSSSDKPEFDWEVNVNVPRASIHDVATLLQSGNDVATAMQSPADKLSQGRPRYSGGPTWIQRLSRSGGRTEGIVLDEWEVPESLSFAEQIDWFHQYLEEKDNIMKPSMSKLLDEATSKNTPFADVDGNISGRVTLKYNSRSGESRYTPSNASAVLQAILDQLTRTSFSFEFGGNNWRVGPARLNRIAVSGTFEDGVLNIGPLTCDGKDGFGAEAVGRITNTGSVDCSALLRKAPADLMNQFSRAPVDVKGECNGRLEIEGNLSNPRAFGRVVWTDATLNGKQVRGAKTDFACINGRCILNADARIGGRKLSSRHDSDDAGIRSLQWGESVISGLKDLATQVSSKPEDHLISQKSGGRGQGESLQVRVSAPVRFYLLKYLQRRTPSLFWSEVEPVLGGSMPSDDEWVLMDVDVKKYGLVLLNTVLPELGWESGDSDIRLLVSGTLADPVIEGKVSVSDGRAAPPLLSEPLQGLRGEIEFGKNGLVSIKSVSGRCQGKGINVNGDIFFSEDHQEQVSEMISANKTLLQSRKPTDSAGRKERRMLMAKQNAAKSAMQRGSRGVTVEFGEFPVNLQNIVLSKLSGKVTLVGTAARPTLGGALTFSDGLISLGNAAVAPRGALASRAKIGAVTESTPRNGGTGKEQGDVKEDSEISQTVENNRVETRLGFPTDTFANGDSNICLDGLRVHLGRNMQVVQPFVLNLDTNGTLILDGSPTQPEIEGEIRVLRGRVNMLATRMSIRKDAKNYVKFVKTDETGTPTAGKALEPLINLTLEGEDLLLRIPECSLSTWAEHLVVADKSGTQLSGATWNALMQSELGELRSPEAVARLIAKYAVKAVEAGGKAGKLEWRVFPALVSKSGGYASGRLRDELGAGAEFELGGLAIGAKRSSDGTHGGRIRLRLRDWLNWELEKEGIKHTSTIKVTVNLPHKRARKEKTSGEEGKTDDSNEEDGQNGGAKQSQGTEPERGTDEQEGARSAQVKEKGNEEEPEAGANPDSGNEKDEGDVQVQVPDGQRTPKVLSKSDDEGIDSELPAVPNVKTVPEG